MRFWPTNITSSRHAGVQSAHEDGAIVTARAERRVIFAENAGERERGREGRRISSSVEIIELFQWTRTDGWMKKMADILVRRRYTMFTVVPATAAARMWTTNIYHSSVCIITSNSATLHPVGQWLSIELFLNWTAADEPHLYARDVFIDLTKNKHSDQQDHDHSWPLLVTNDVMDIKKSRMTLNSFFCHLLHVSEEQVQPMFLE